MIPQHALTLVITIDAVANPQAPDLHLMPLQLYFPQQGVCIAFSPSGVRAPQRATQGQPGRAPATAEPYSEEAFSFTRHHCLQREVLICLSSCATAHHATPCCCHLAPHQHIDKPSMSCKRLQARLRSHRSIHLSPASKSPGTDGICKASHCGFKPFAQPCWLIWGIGCDPVLVLLRFYLLDNGLKCWRSI